MTEHTQPLTPRPLSRQEALELKNRRTLVTVFQISWIMVFVCLVVVCLQIKSTTTQPALTPVQFAVPTIATLALLISGWTVWRALAAIRRDERAAFRSGWLITIALGGAFLAIMLAVFFNNPYSGQYEQIFRVMIGYHGLHALVIGIWMIQVYRNAQQGAYGSQDSWGVEAGAKLWGFVIIAWVLFYIALFLI